MLQTCLTKDLFVIKEKAETALASALYLCFRFILLVTFSLCQLVVVRQHFLRNGVVNLVCFRCIKGIKFFKNKTLASTHKVPPSFSFTNKLFQAFVKNCFSVRSLVAIHEPIIFKFIFVSSSSNSVYLGRRIILKVDYCFCKHQYHIGISVKRCIVVVLSLTIIIDRTKKLFQY